MSNYGSTTNPVTTVILSRQTLSSTSDDDVTRPSSSSRSNTYHRQLSLQRPNIPPPPVPVSSASKGPQTVRAAAAPEPSPRGHQAAPVSLKTTPHNGTSSTPPKSTATTSGSRSNSEKASKKGPTIPMRTSSVPLKDKPEPLAALVTNASSYVQPSPDSPSSMQVYSGGQVDEVVTITVHVEPGDSLSGKRLLDIGHQDPLAHGSEVKDFRTGITYRRKNNGVYFRLTAAIDCKTDQPLEPGDEILAIAGYQLADMTLDTARMLFDDYAQGTSFTLTVAKTKRGWFDDIHSPSHSLSQVDFNANEKVVQQPVDNDVDVRTNGDNDDLCTLPESELPPQQDTELLPTPAEDYETAVRSSDRDSDDVNDVESVSPTPTDDVSLSAPAVDAQLLNQPEDPQPPLVHFDEPTIEHHPATVSAEELSASDLTSVIDVEIANNVELETQQPHDSPVDEPEVDRMHETHVADVDLYEDSTQEAPPLPQTLPPGDDFDQAEEQTSVDPPQISWSAPDDPQEADVGELPETSPESGSLADDILPTAELTPASAAIFDDSEGQEQEQLSTIPVQLIVDPLLDTPVDHVVEVDATPDVDDSPNVASSEPPEPLASADDIQPRKSSNEEFSAYVSLIAGQGFNSHRQVASPVRPLMTRSASIEKQPSIDDDTVADDKPVDVVVVVVDVENNTLTSLEDSVETVPISSPDSDENRHGSTGDEFVLSSTVSDQQPTDVVDDVLNDNAICDVIEDVVGETSLNAEAVDATTDVAIWGSVNSSVVFVEVSTHSDEYAQQSSEAVPEEVTVPTEVAENDVVDALPSDPGPADASVVADDRKPEVDEVPEVADGLELSNDEQIESPHHLPDDSSDTAAPEAADVVVVEEPEVGKRCSTAIYIELTPDTVDVVRSDDSSFNVTIRNNSRDLGLEVHRNTDGAVVVAQLDKDGAAYRNGNIRTGDVIQRINDVDTVDLSDDEIRSVLDSVSDVVTLRIVTAEYLQSLREDSTSEQVPANDQVPTAINEQLQLQIEPLGTVAAHHKVEISIPSPNAHIPDGAFVGEASPSLPVSDDRSEAVRKTSSSSCQSSDSDVMTKSRRSVSSDQSVSGILRDYFLPDAVGADSANQTTTTPAKPIISQALLPKAFRSTTQIQTIGAYAVPTCLLKTASQDQPTAGRERSAVAVESVSIAARLQSPRSSLSSETSEDDTRARSTSRQLGQDDAVGSVDERADGLVQEYKDTPNMADSKAFFESIQRRTSTGPSLKPKPIRGSSLATPGKRLETSSTSSSAAAAVQPVASAVTVDSPRPVASAETDEAPSMSASRAFFESLQRPRSSVGNSSATSGSSRSSVTKVVPFPSSPAVTSSELKRSDSIGSSTDDGSVESNERGSNVAEVGEMKSPPAPNAADNELPASKPVAESRSLFESLQRPRSSVGGGSATPSSSRSSFPKPGFPPLPGTTLKRSESLGSHRKVVAPTNQRASLATVVGEGDGLTTSGSNSTNEDVPAAMLVAESRALFEAKSTAAAASTPPPGLRGSTTSSTVNQHQSAVQSGQTPSWKRPATATDGDKPKLDVVPPPTVPKPVKPVASNAPEAGPPSSPLRRASSTSIGSSATAAGNNDVTVGQPASGLRPRPSLSGADGRSKAWKEFMSTYANINKSKD